MSLNASCTDIHRIERAYPWIGSLYSMNIGARSIQRHLSSIKGFFKYLQKNHRINQSPFELISGPKMEKKLPETLTPEQINRLLDFKPTSFIEIRDLAIMELMYSSGLRVSETVNVNIHDFEEGKDFLRVVGKGSKTRLVPLGRFAISAIDNWLEERKKITNKDGAPSLLVIFFLSSNQLSIALMANLPKGTNRVFDPLPTTLKKSLPSSKSWIFTLTVSETLNPEEYINSIIAKSLISINEVGLKSNNLLICSGVKVSGSFFSIFGPEISSNGD